MIRVNNVYSQRDRRWSSLNLGFSSLKISGFGCVVVSLSHLLQTLGYNETPATVNNKLKAAKGFTGALVIWDKVAQVWPKMKFVKLAYSYNNVEVAWYVYWKRIPVIVKVHAPQIGAVSHWVLYVGDHLCVDPWDGQIKQTSTYKALRYVLFDRQ